MAFKTMDEVIQFKYQLDSCGIDTTNLAVIVDEDVKNNLAAMAEGYHNKGFDYLFGVKVVWAKKRYQYDYTI